MENQQRKPIFAISCFVILIAFRLLFFVAFLSTGVLDLNIRNLLSSEIIESVILIAIVTSLNKNRKNITLLAMGGFALRFLFELFRINFAHPVRTLVFKTVAFDLSSFLIWGILAIFILIDTFHYFDRLKSKKVLLNKIFIFIFVVYCVICLVKLYDGFSSKYYQIAFGSGYGYDFEDLWFELFSSYSLYGLILDKFAYIVYAIALIPLKMWIYPTSNKLLNFINNIFKKILNFINKFSEKQSD